MRRVRITLGYDGTEFVGSQAQPGQRTVQSELDRLLARLSPRIGRTVFAGRTDRGVHARAQVVSVDVDWRGSANDMRDALNALAPVDIAIQSVDDVSESFHARYDAISREYRYRIVVADVPPIFERRYVWWRRSPIDGLAAAEAAANVVGEHRFGTFAGHGKSQSLAPDQLVRRVRRCDWRVAADGRYHELRIVANGFLPQMVRNIVAAVVQVGSGTRDPGWICELIEANDRRVLGDAAPPQGLALWRVAYGIDVTEKRDEAADAGRLPGGGYEEE